VFAGASIVGPLVGGFIVDNMSWRWIFYVNLPVGGLALAVILVTMQSRPYKQEHSIDWLGAAILAAGTTALLLGLVWGGNEYPWGSPEVLGALMAAIVLIAAFGLVEHRVVEPILPFDLLRNQTVSSSVACMALVGAAMFGTISFVPLFVQGVIGTSATSSGVVLTPLILGAVTATALTQFARSIGATLGVTLLGVIVNQNLPSGLQTSGVAIHRLPPAGRAALANALHPAFLAAVFLCAAVFVISLLWVREAPLRTELEGIAVGDEVSPQPGTRAAARRVCP